MSTIRVDNFGPSAGGTTYSARGIAKSWVNFDGTGTVAIRDSENVASLTDNGTGDYTVNFSSNMSDDGYAANTTCSDLSFGAKPHFRFANGAVYTASECRVRYTQGSSNTFEDPVRVIFLAHGDLA